MSSDSGDTVAPVKLAMRNKAGEDDGKKKPKKAVGETQDTPESHVDLCKNLVANTSTYKERFKASTSMEQAPDGKVKKETDAVALDLQKCKTAICAKASQLN